MIHSAWSFNEGNYPDNVFKAWMRIEVEDKCFGNSQAIKKSVINISTPKFPYHSKYSCPDYELEITREEGPEETWKMKLFYQFGIKRRPEALQFRGKLSLRSTSFGTWEPFQHTTFLSGNVLEPPEYAFKKLYNFKILETLPKSLSSHFIPAGNSTRNLEAQLVLEFGDHSIISQIEMRAAFESRNYFHAIKKTDCIIQVNETKFYCHSEKIKAMSNVLERLFEHEENPLGSKITRDWSEYFTSPKAMQTFLRFVYYNELPATRPSFQNLFDLMKFAHMFSITTLEQASELLILESPKIEKIRAALGFQVYSFSKKVDSLERLKKKMCVVLKRNACTYDKNVLVEFAKEDTESFVEVFQCDDKKETDSDEKGSTDDEISDN